MQQLEIFIKNLNQQLESNLSSINQVECKVNKYQKATEYYYDIILQLKSFVINYSFNDINEEINFFKNIKPQFTSEYIFNNKALHILIQKPIGKEEVILEYFENNLKEITCFFDANQEFYRYYRLNSNYHDALFFVRQRKEFLHLTDANLNNFEPEFSSSHDYLLAKIIANDRLEEFIKEQIQIQKNQNQTPTPYNATSFNKQTLEWTDKKSDLIELIYALHAKGSINGGQCDIRKIAELFEKTFKVELQGTYRTYQDIKNRSSQTKFIDSLKNSLQAKIDEDYL